MVTLLLDSAEVGCTAAGLDGSFSLAIGDLAEGDHTLVAVTDDAAGNRSAACNPTSVGLDLHGPTTTGRAASARVGRKVALKYRVTDNLSPKAKGVRIVVRNAGGATVETFRPGQRATATWYAVTWRPRIRGAYRYSIYASDLAGNTQAKVGSGRVSVR